MSLFVEIPQKKISATVVDVTDNPSNAVIYSFEGISAGSWVVNDSTNVDFARLRVTFYPRTRKDSILANSVDPHEKWDNSDFIIVHVESENGSAVSTKVNINGIGVYEYLEIQTDESTAFRDFVKSEVGNEIKFWLEYDKSKIEISRLFVNGEERRSLFANTVEVFKRTT